jgi:peptide/nickel transport system permease protein
MRLARWGPGWLAAWRKGVQSELFLRFLESRIAVFAALLTLFCVGAAALAPWLAPHNPYVLSSLELSDARMPPAWQTGGQTRFLLGTDDQGRDLLSATLYGARLSLTVGLAAVALSVAVGVAVGLLSGFVGGALDSSLMRLCDVMLSFPAILVALLVDGLARALWPASQEALATGVLVFSIALTGWVPYARTVRGSTLSERRKDYVQAAELIGVRPARIMFSHVLPNVLGPAMVIATIQVAQAIQIEAALSFLGVGVPPTEPSLGTLIRMGQESLFSGEWWVVVFPGVMLVLIALGINLLGDWLRDALNPRLL